jgi:hypothetical protein
MMDVFPPKRRFLQEPHGVTSQKTAFFIVTAVETESFPVEAAYTAALPQRGEEPRNYKYLGCNSRISGRGDYSYQHFS